ncbi:28S ribosomal protein S23, partial [Blattella germanica]
YINKFVRIHIYILYVNGVTLIYCRVKGLLKSGAMKEEDKPMWYEIYKAFPPKYEPRYDRPAPDIPIRKIFYPEDIIRAKYHKENKYVPAPSINLIETRGKTETQKLISVYEKLKEEGNTKEEDLYAAAVDVIKAERSIAKDRKSASQLDVSTTSFVSSFEEAQKEKNLKKSVDIKDIFKD